MKKAHASKIALSKDYEAIIKRAQKQPGIKELSKAYGRYELLLKQTSVYRWKNRPKIIVSASHT